MEAESSITHAINTVEAEPPNAQVSNNMEAEPSDTQVTNKAEAESSVPPVAISDKTEPQGNTSDRHLAVQHPSTSPAHTTSNHASSPAPGSVIEFGLNGMDFDKNQWPPWLSPAIDVLHKLSSNKFWQTLIQDWLSVENMLKFPGRVCTLVSICVIY